MILDIVIGFLLATIGITILNSVCEIIVAITELIKGVFGIKIIKYNEEIENYNRPKEPVQVAGFTIYEDDDEEDED